jgi:hypothetical protein
MRIDDINNEAEKLIQHYKNTTMLTQQGDLKLLRTKIYQIVEL